MLMRSAVLTVLLCAMISIAALAQAPASSTAKTMKEYFADIDKKILAMAEDLPADKYDYKLKPEMRSFREVIVHVASGNIYADKIGRGENVKWDELDAKNYKDKAAVVALLKQVITKSEATLNSQPDSAFQKNLEPWIGVTEHTAEHYGLLVAYYRAMGLVPPASRK